jgi:hypothetical protein
MFINTPFSVCLIISIIQTIPGGKINILGSYSIIHSKQKCVHVHGSSSGQFLRYSYFNVQGHQDALRRATCHVLARVAKCIDVDGGIFKNALY